MKISRQAHSKLNLFLKVTGKRKNFHELYSLVVFLNLADEITVEPAVKIEVHEVGGNSDIKDNIIARTAKKLAQQYSVKDGVKISFVKNIPLSAGLGGGSADAAAVIVLLNDLWNLKLKHEEMYKLGLELGADVPVCLYSILENKNAAVISGIGEIIQAAPEMPKLHFVLANPGKELSTQEVFKAFRSKGLKPASFTMKDDLIKSLNATGNDLEPAAKKLLPEIGVIIDELTRLETCQLARMSGSGGTCFGLFGNRREVKLAAAELLAKHPEWKIRPAVLKKTSIYSFLKNWRRHYPRDNESLQKLADKLESHDAKTLRARSFALSFFCHLLIIFLYQVVFIPRNFDEKPRYIEISLADAAAAENFPAAPTSGEDMNRKKSPNHSDKSLDLAHNAEPLPATTANVKTSTPPLRAAEHGKRQKLGEADTVDYLELLQYTVQQMSRIPASQANLRGLAILRLEFTREGYVTAYTLRKKTGSKTLDAAAISIAKKLMREPFPPAPPSFDRGEKILKYDFIIRYPPEKR